MALSSLPFQSGSTACSTTSTSNRTRTGWSFLNQSTIPWPSFSTTSDFHGTFLQNCFRSFASKRPGSTRMWPSSIAFTLDFISSAFFTRHATSRSSSEISLSSRWVITTLGSSTVSILLYLRVFLLFEQFPNGTGLEVLAPGVFQKQPTEVREGPVFKLRRLDDLLFQRCIHPECHEPLTFIHD